MAVINCIWTIFYQKFNTLHFSWVACTWCIRTLHTPVYEKGYGSFDKNPNELHPPPLLLVILATNYNAYTVWTRSYIHVDMIVWNAVCDSVSVDAKYLPSQRKIRYQHVLEMWKKNSSQWQCHVAISRLSMLKIYTYLCLLDKSPELCTNGMYLVILTENVMEC